MLSVNIGFVSAVSSLLLLDVITAVVYESRRDVVLNKNTVNSGHRTRKWRL